MLRRSLVSVSSPVTPQQLRLKTGVLNAVDKESGPSDVRVVLDFSLAGQQIHRRFLQSRAASALALDPVMKGKEVHQRRRPLKCRGTCMLMVSSQPISKTTMPPRWACITLGTGPGVLSNTLEAAHSLAAAMSAAECSPVPEHHCAPTGQSQRQRSRSCMSCR